MSRRLAALALVLATGVAHAQPAETAPSSVTPEDVGDQGIAAEIGITTGGRVTPGGLRIVGHYLYQMSTEDWFDGAATFTYGGGGAACFRDRTGATVCDHDFADGEAVELSANVRRVFARQGPFRPFARAGIGVALVRFSADDVTGVAIPLNAGGGLRALVAPSIAIVAQVDLELGFGGFNRGLGLEPQLGFSVTAGAEFILR
jgi:opacity protein-like surface antigen